MDDRIIEFSNILRRNGIRVSLSETMDAFRATGLLGIGNGVMFKDGLRSALIKRSADGKIFDRLFDGYFLGTAAPAGDSDSNLMARLRLSPEGFQRLLDEIRRLLDLWQVDPSALTRALLSGDTTRTQSLLLEAVESQRLDPIDDSGQIEGYVQMMMSYLGFSRVQEELKRFALFARQAGVGADKPEEIDLYVDQRLTEVSDMIRRLVELQLTKNGAASWEPGSLDPFAQKSFAFYTEEDVRRMHEAVV
ncbi:MAG: hypothetical protein ACREP8_14145, partial [Candidatus Binatia bacterium]